MGLNFTSDLQYKVKNERQNDELRLREDEEKKMRKIRNNTSTYLASLMQSNTKIRFSSGPRSNLRLF